MGLGEYVLRVSRSPAFSDRNPPPRTQNTERSVLHSKVDPDTVNLTLAHPEHRKIATSGTDQRAPSGPSLRPVVYGKRS
jgi:hypothetical protein